MPISVGGRRRRLDRREEARFERFHSIRVGSTGKQRFAESDGVHRKIKQAVDKETTQPVSYADLIAIVPHFAARIQFKKDYMAEVGGDDNYEFLFIGTNPFLSEGARWTLGRYRSRSGRLNSKLGNRDGAGVAAWFERVGSADRTSWQLWRVFYEDPKKGVEVVSQDST